MMSIALLLQCTVNGLQMQFNHVRRLCIKVINCPSTDSNGISDSSVIEVYTFMQQLCHNGIKVCVGLLSRLQRLHDFTWWICRTECTQTHLFAISGNGPKFSYDLLQYSSKLFIDFPWKTAMFTITSDGKDTAWNESRIHVKKFEQEYAYIYSCSYSSYFCL